MSWDEGKPMPSSPEAKKVLAKQMMGSKSSKEPSEGPMDEHNLEGTFESARIESASNGHTLDVTRRIPAEAKKAESIGTDSPVEGSPASLHDSYDGSGDKLKTYKTVHMTPQHLGVELQRHMVKGQAGGAITE